jgi:hypothetical protein
VEAEAAAEASEDLAEGAVLLEAVVPVEDGKIVFYKFISIF